MAQVGQTPIQIYYSDVAGHVPSPTNLLPGELAINIADGLLYYKDSIGLIQTISGGGGGGGGVTSFNGRIGTVSLTTLDVTTALGYTPVQPNGTGATGTWGISISGNAATATSATTAASATTATTATSATTATTATTAGYATTAGEATMLVSSNFKIVQSGSKLYFKYNNVDIASLDSTGNFVALGNVGAFTTP